MSDEPAITKGIMDKMVGRRALMGGALGTALALPLAPALTAQAAGGTRSARRAAPAQTEGKGGTIVIDLGSEVENLDPHQQLTGTTAMVNAQLFEGLVRFKPGTVEVEPCLATSWESSADGLTWTFKLSEDVTFHDGTPFNADAVKFNYDRQFDPNNEYYPLGQWSGTYAFNFLSGVTVVDPYTVTFTLTTPFNKFLERMNTMLFVSPAAVQQYREAMIEHPVGTGPYKFDRWDKGQQVVLSRFDEYHKYEPTLDQVVFKAIPEAGARAAALLSGDVHLAVEITPEIAEQLSTNDQFQVVTGPTGALWFLAMNVEFEAFKDKRVRQALNFAIDKETICSAILNDTASVGFGPLSPAYPDYNPKVEEYYSYDPERAKQLLQEAGYAGETIAFRTSIGGSGMLSPEEMATFIQDNLREIGVTTEIEVIEFVSWMDAIRNPQNELTVMSWNLAPIEPDLMFNGILSKASLPPGFNTSYWVNDEFEALIETGRSSLDPAEVTTAYHRAQEIVMEEAPIVPVCHRLQVYGVSKLVQNFTAQPSLEFLLKGVWVSE
jgi:peptide/nickel transport system substrate-binding protein